MGSCIRHIALFVPDLRAAEEYYQSLLGMELIGREAELEDDLWYTLPLEKSWDDAEAASIELGMLALRKDSQGTRAQGYRLRVLSPLPGYNQLAKWQG